MFAARVLFNPSKVKIHKMQMFENSSIFHTLLVVPQRARTRPHQSTSADELVKQR